MNYNNELLSCMPVIACKTQWRFQELLGGVLVGIHHLSPDASVAYLVFYFNAEEQIKNWLFINSEELATVLQYARTYGNNCQIFLIKGAGKVEEI